MKLKPVQKKVGEVTVWNQFCEIGSDQKYDWLTILNEIEYETPKLQNFVFFLIDRSHARFKLDKNSWL